MASAPDSDTRVIPTCVGKLGIDSFVAFVISGHPHLCGEIRVVVLMVAPAWRGFGGCSRTTPNPRNRTGGGPGSGPPPVLKRSCQSFTSCRGGNLCEASGADDVSSLVPQLRVRVKEVTSMRRSLTGEH